MLGHRLLADLRHRHDVRATLRQPLEAYHDHRLFDSTSAIAGVDARLTDSLAEVLAATRPEAVVNCVGIVKQRPSANDAIASLEINALLPHRLARLCRIAGARLIHISTDCVFSGRKGGYLETDPSDAEDIYGRTKYLGEVAENHCLTLRTSIVGRELARKTGLLEWFLAQKGTVSGFSNAIFSGLTTNELSRVIEGMLVDHQNASGIFQVSSAPIDKYSLLLLFQKYLSPDTQVVPDARIVIDRSLDSTRFRNEFGYQPPTWEAMVKELADQKWATEK